MERLSVVGVSLALLLVACTAAGQTPVPSQSWAPSTAPSASAAPSPTPDVRSSPEPTAAPSSAASAAPSASPWPLGSVVVTIEDRVRVRSKPEISDASFMYPTLLPAGTQLFVVDGPVAGSGYSWYEVAPISSGDLPTGWVAAASRSGEPWLAADVIDCPTLPTDFRSLAALGWGVGFTCFPRVPISVEARLVESSCDVDPGGGWFEPRWFAGAGEQLVDPAQTRGPGCSGEQFSLYLDPMGQHPGELPVGKVVIVTGIFDHPAAAACTWTDWDHDKEVASEPVPDTACRMMFAVTAIEE